MAWLSLPSHKQEVYDQCSGEYQQRTNGLPWPGKFHCHRFPSYVDQYNHNGNNTMEGASDEENYNTGGTTIPCTMPPFNYDGH